MAERTGIPKRTLDKYMLREGASLPGFEALCALSKGLGVSLDWLVFGAEGSSRAIEVMALRAAHDAVLVLMETLLAEYKRQNPEFVVEERILDLTPEHWAQDMAWRVAEDVRKQAEQGVTLEELLNWELRMKARSSEVLRDLIEYSKSRSSAGHAGEVSKGNGN